jgi:lipoyl(octanoyl) transferase
MPPTLHSLTPNLRVSVVDLGSMSYAEAFDRQRAEHARVLSSRLGRRDAADAAPTPADIGVILLVEHDPPVLTVSKRPSARTNILADPSRLQQLGVEVLPTDRGGDITYHGPGQLVAYPILDLNALTLNLHAYMRLLEQAVIDTCARFGVAATRDENATGVWVDPSRRAQRLGLHTSGGAKICAMGIRASRWVTMHGLALNVTTTLEHFDLIVPCGLAGRPVTSLAEETAPPLAEETAPPNAPSNAQHNDRTGPTLQSVKPVLTDALLALLARQAERSTNTPS